MPYLLDTNIFNRLIDGTMRLDNLPADAVLYATHIQIDEINRTRDHERRAQLALRFASVRPTVLPTESAVWDVSRWDHAKWSDGQLLEQLKQRLDTRNKAKSNNIQDALIAEVAIANGLTLLTADRDLAAVVSELGGSAAACTK